MGRRGTHGDTRTGCQTSTSWDSSKPQKLKAADMESFFWWAQTTMLYGNKMTG